MTGSPGAIAETGSNLKYPVEPVYCTAVKLDDAFWAPRIHVTRAITIPYALKKCAVTISNLLRAAGLERGHFQGSPPRDSDVYKVMEGAAYSLAAEPDLALRRQLDDLVSLVARAQEPDGYLYTARTIEGAHAPDPAGPVRWLNESGGVTGSDSHELYVMGHLIEAAVAHYEVTGSRAFLDAAIKTADLIQRTWGSAPGQLQIPPGHPEVELALVKLARASGNPAYVDLARFLLDCRGHYRRPPGVNVRFPDSYDINEVPLDQLTVATGHAVRAAYLLSGMTDVAALRDDAGLEHASDAIWVDTIGTKLYLHGGLGSGVGMAEGFGKSYALPNAGYSETCAAVANCLWNHRLFLLHADSRYLDVLERALYNNVLAGVSLSGDRFFYQNPLVAHGTYTRSPWFQTPCCPTNIARMIPSVPGLVYARQGERLFVALYAAGTCTVPMKDGAVRLTQATNYPWDGKVRIAVEPEKAMEFELNLRLPGWAVGSPVPGSLYSYLAVPGESPGCQVNGVAVPLATQKGFVAIKRRWTAGDVVELDLPMPIRRVLANDKVTADAGRVALERGPVVYCIEGADFGGPIDHLWLPDDALLTPGFRPDLLGGVTVLSGTTSGLFADATGRVGDRAVAFTAIPYHAWDNRGANPMAVWLPRRRELARPRPEVA